MRNRAVIFLFVLYFVYLFIGAAIFYALEFANEETLCSEALEQLQQYNLTGANENITVENLRNLIEVLLQARSNGIQFNSELQPRCAHNWNWPNAFFFAGTVVTTIGYGNISPNTGGGRVFCIFFAAIGLPIFGIMFSEIGERFAELFKKLEIKLEPKLQRLKLRKGIVLVLLVSSVVVLFLLIPSIIFMAVEGWSYQDSFYYSFITLTTIGFGDFVVGTNPDNVDTSYTTVYRFAVYFWILFGLALMAAVISIFSEIIKSNAKPDNNETEKDSGPEASPMQKNNGSDATKNDIHHIEENPGPVKGLDTDSMESCNVVESDDSALASKDVANRID